MRPKHFSCVLNSSMVTSMETRILANGTVRKFQVDKWTHGLNSTIFSIFKNCAGLIPDLKKISCKCLWCSCLLMILIFWVAEEFNYCKVCKSSLIFSYVFALQFRKDLFIKNVPPEFQKEKSNGLSVKVCKMYCDWDVCVPDSSIQCQDHSTTHCYGKDECNIPWDCQLPDWL